VRVTFTPRGWEDYVFWQGEDAKTLRKLTLLIQDCRRDPFTGLGEPEPLKHQLRGWWSRRISQEHRLVYRVAGSGDDQRLEIAQCRFHY
jgi:toxin YoeB